LLRSLRYGTYGAVIAGVVGGIVAWNHSDKTVTLVVDGHARTVHTTAAEVGDVLQAAGYHDSAHDILAPGPTSAVHNGETIVFRRGRLLHLDVDGSTSYVWTTAPTVAAAMSQLGFSTADFTSVSRSRRLPLRPTDISVRTPKQVTIEHDGTTQTVHTTDETVGQLLRDLAISVAPGDRLSAPRSGELTPGETLVVTRVTRGTLMTTRTIPFRVRHQHDASLPAGHTKVVQAGRAGLAQTTYAIVYVDGKVAGRTKVRTMTVRTPQPRIIAIGTKPPSTTATTANVPDVPNVSPGSAQDIARQLLSTHGWGEDQFGCLVTLWNHESGWRVNASNPSGAYGIPQAVPGDKMAAYGSDWRTSAKTQIEWGLAYIAERYGDPCNAWTQWNNQGGWY